MADPDTILEAALTRKQYALSEYDSKQILAAYGIPITREALVQHLHEAQAAASRIGYPVVLKACSHAITHKTEKGLIHVDLRHDADLREAFQSLRQHMQGLDGDVLVQEMVKGPREFVLGMIRDPQFGPCVMFGLGGIFTEVLDDVCFRVAPIDLRDALEMMADIRGHKLLSAMRGMAAVDQDVLAESLIALGRIGLEHEMIQEIDVNPMIVRGSRPVAVDALVVLQKGEDV
jgi:acyl-CoA synthetase (NDP forming)